MKIWTTPAGSLANYAREIISGYHVLIAGATGAGKSVLINRLIYDCLLFAPCEKQFILIDPKRVELSIYKNLPHCLYYGNTAQTITAAINNAYNLMLQRFQKMEREQTRTYSGATVYVVIDEYTDIKYNYPDLIDKIILISSTGRATKIILIIATQRPTRDILNGAIQCNFNTRIGLRTDSKQDARNILNCSGCENLPLFGYGYLKTPNYKNPQLFQIEQISDAEIIERVNFWVKQKQRG